MERINISKALTSNTQSTVINAPSLAGSKIKSTFKNIPALNNFLKSIAVVDLDNRKVGIYNLKKKTVNTKGDNSQSIILTYKVFGTSYKINSCIKITRPKVRQEIVEGSVTISRGLFKRKDFKLAELPKNVVDAINNHITQFNVEYVAYLVEKEQTLKEQALIKEESFWEGIDL